jgi:hypothetical protein
MYGYSISTEEGGAEQGEEGAESVEEEGGGVESGEAEEGNSPPTITSQTSTNPSSPSPPPPSTSHQLETSHKNSSKSIVDSKPTIINAPGSSDEPDLVHHIVEDHDILAEEVEIEEHPADLPGSSSSVLGKHPRSEGEELGDDTVYRDVMLSSRTALEGTCI